MIPDSPDALLTRRATANALTEAGYPMKPTTLATKATRGGGPPYRRFGAVALYSWGDALEWAQSRLSAPIRSTSELDPRAIGAGETSAPLDAVLSYGKPGSAVRENPDPQLG
jgi:hypothetical protein